MGADAIESAVALGAWRDDANNQTFVAAIAAKYGKRLRRFLSARLRNSADASDLAQEIFLRLRGWTYEAIRSPEAYLFTVASHVLHQHAVLQAATPPALDISEVFAELQSLAEDGPEARSGDVQKRVLRRDRRGRNTSYARISPLASVLMFQYATD